MDGSLGFEGCSDAWLPAVSRLLDARDLTAVIDDDALGMLGGVGSRLSSLLPLVAKRPATAARLTDVVLPAIEEPWLRPRWPSAWDLTHPPPRRLGEHRGGVRAIAVSPDATEVVSGGDDGRVIRWVPGSPHRGDVIADLPRRIRSVALAVRRRLVAAGSADGSLILCRLDGAPPQRIGAFDGEARALSFDHTERWLYVGHMADGLERYDLLNRRWETLATADGGVRALALTPRSDAVVFGCTDRSVRLLDLSSLTTRVLGRHETAVRAVVVLVGGTRVASSSSDRTVRVWEMAGTGHLMQQIDWGVGRSLAPGVDDRTVTVGSDDRTVRLLDLRSGDQRVLTIHHGGVGAVARSANGQSVASGGFDGSIRLSDGTGEGRRHLASHDGEVRSVGAGGGVVASVGSDRYLKVWSRDGTARVLGRHDALPRGCAVDPTGAIVATTAYDRTVRVWTGADESGTVVGRLNGWGRCILVDPHRRWVVAGSGDGTVRVFPIDGGPGRLLGEHDGWVRALSWLDDGEAVASLGDDKHVRRWSMAGDNGQLLVRLDEPARAMATNRTGGLVIGTDFGQVLVCRRGFGRRVVGRHGSVVRAVAPLSGGALVASGGTDGAVRLWSVDTGEELARHWALGEIHSLAALSDDQLVVGDATGTVQVLTLDRRAR